MSQSSVRSNEENASQTINRPPNTRNNYSALDHQEDSLSKCSLSAIIQTVLLIILLGVTCYCLYLVNRNNMIIKELEQQKLSQSIKIHNLQQKLGQSYKRLQIFNRNLTFHLQNIKEQSMRMEVDIYKNKNHNKNLLEITKKDKKQLNDALQLIRAKDAFSQPRYIHSLRQLKRSIKQTPFLPKILWVYTEFKFSEQKMLEQILGNYIIHQAQNSGFQIKYANSWSAYQHLSEKTAEKITKTMQNSQLEAKVDELLRIALLMEHGGVLIKVSEALLYENFTWLGNYFKLNGTEIPNDYNEVVLFAQKSAENNNFEYSDFFIAAIKDSQFAKDMFDYLCTLVRTASPQFQRLKKAIVINHDTTNSTEIIDFSKNTMNALFDAMTAEYYAVGTVTILNDLRSDKDCQKGFVEYLKRPEWQYRSKCGSSPHLIHIKPSDRSMIEDQLQGEIQNQRLEADNFSYWYSLMTIPANKKVYEPLPPRDVHFCIIDAHPDSQHQKIINSFQKLKQQSFKDISAVYFVKDETPQNKNYVNSQEKKGFKITLPLHTGSIGRNYEVGIIKYCPNKSFIMVLRRQETISQNDGLEILSNSVRPRGVLGTLNSLNMSGVIKQTDTYMQWYNKLQFNARNPNFDILNNIKNYLRVFHSDCYKLIPQFDLRSPQGLYFQDRFNFLEQFMFMVRNITFKHDDTEIDHVQRVRWFIKSNSQLLDVPNRIIIFRNLIINTEIWDEIDKKELKRNYYKTDSYAMSYNMDHLVQNGIPMSQFAVFNPGDQYQPYTVRNKPQLIPKKVHVVWIEGQLSPVKKKIFEMNQALYPDFEFKLWGKANVTKQRFPLSYDLIQNIYNMENISRYSKRATMADVLRHQALYYQGGFYMDSSMILFNNVFYKWLGYKFALSTERTFRHRWAQSMCIFGVMPQFPGLLRIISHNNTNRYNLWKRDALEIAGPHNFRWTVRGYEEYDPDYLIMDYDTFYPMAYSLPSYFDTYCYIQPAFLGKQDEPAIKWMDRWLIKDCGKYYPYSFGKEISNIGNTWQRAKW